MRILKFAVVTALLVLPVAQVQASVLANVLFDGDSMADVITDDSAGTFVEKAGILQSDGITLSAVDGILEEGDLIQGIITLGPIGGSPVPAGSSIVGAYSLEVTGIGPGGSALSLGAASGADSITSILSAAGADFSGLTGSHVGAMNGFAVLETSTGTVDRPDFSATFDFGLPTSDFDVSMVLGFDGIDDHYDVVAGALLPGGDLTDLSAIDSLDGLGVSVASFIGTFTVTDHSFGPSTVFLPLTNVFTGATGDVTILNGGISSTNADTQPNGFDFNDDGDFNINAVPEPMSVLVWGGLACAAGMVSARRRNA